MMREQSSNKTIARNTLMLYIRMFITLLVSLYTSRVVLQTLGVEDYGIYGVVGGIVSMFAFLNSTMASATQRFLTFELGTGNKEKLHRVFCMCLQIHIVLAVVICLCAEAVGPWFIQNKMTIPADRMFAAHWVFHCSVLSCMLNVICIPYNALIIAHERMDAFAYISIFETMMKLLIVYLLLCFNADKLILYAVLTLGVSILMRSIYSIYSKRHFEESSFVIVKDRELFRSICGFSFWNVFGSVSVIGLTQGVNLILNIFFGPIVNAARTIADQITGLVSSFVGGFTTSINPQITKQYAAGEYQRMYSLICTGGKFSFFLLYILALPVFFECETILSIWLGMVPDHAVIFARLSILIALTNSLSSSMIAGIAATGRMKNYSVGLSVIYLLVLPLSYWGLKLGYSPEIVLYIQLIMYMICQFYRMTVCKRLVGLPILLYAKKVFLRIFPAAILSFFVTLIFYSVIASGILRIIVIVSVSLMCNIVFFYLLGLTQNERQLAYSFVKNKILRR